MTPSRCGGHGESKRSLAKLVSCGLLVPEGRGYRTPAYLELPEDVRAHIVGAKRSECAIANSELTVTGALPQARRVSRQMLRDAASERGAH